jgi:hypothetical protein
MHNSVDAMTEVHGSSAKCYKGNSYTSLEYGHGRVLNVDCIADKAEHRYRRQIWDKAFTTKGRLPNPLPKLPYTYMT